MRSSFQYSHCIQHAIWLLPFDVSQAWCIPPIIVYLPIPRLFHPQAADQVRHYKQQLASLASQGRRLQRRLAGHAELLAGYSEQRQALGRALTELAAGAMEEVEVQGGAGGEGSVVEQQQELGRRIRVSNGAGVDAHTVHSAWFTFQPRSIHVTKYKLFWEGILVSS